MSPRPSLPLAEGGGQGNLQMLRRLLSRRKYLILSIVVGIVVATWIALNFITPLYTSTATLLIDPQNNNPLQTRLSGPVDLTDVQDEIEVLRSTSLLTKVADTLDLYHDPEFNPTLPHSSDKAEIAGARVTDMGKAIVINHVLDAINVQMRGRSRVLAVGATSEDPMKAVKIATQLLEQYTRDDIATKLNGVRDARERLGKQVDELREKADQAQNAMFTFRDAHPQVDDREVNATTQQLNEVATQLANAQGQRADRDARLRQAGGGGAGIARATGSDGDVMSSQLIQNLRLQQAEYQRQKAQLSSRYGPLHPKIKEIDAQVADLQHKIDEEIGRIGASLKDEADVAAERERSLAATRDTLLKNSERAGLTTTQYANLQHDAETARTVYEAQLGRYKEVQVQESAISPTARLLSTPTLPDSPVFPRKGRVLAVAFAFGLLLAFAVVYMIEGMDDRFQSPEQVESEVGLPCSAVIPSVSRGWQRRRVEDVVLEQVNSPYHDLMQGLLADLGLLDDGAGPETVLVTSSVKNEGKTATAISLGRLAMSLDGASRVLLIDCDLRRSGDYTMSNLSVAATLHDYLTGKAEIDQIIAHEDKSGLDVIVAGGPAINVPNLIGSARMRRLIAELRKTYPVILLDGPGVVGHIETRLLLQLATQSVFLIEWAETPREVVVTALRPFAEGHSQVSLVLSKANLSRMAKYSAVAQAQQDALGV